MRLTLNQPFTWALGGLSYSFDTVTAAVSIFPEEAVLFSVFNGWGNETIDNCYFVPSNSDFYSGTVGSDFLWEESSSVDSFWDWVEFDSALSELELG